MFGPEVRDDEINACPFDELTDPPGVREQIRFTQIFSFDFGPLEHLVRAGFHDNLPPALKTYSLVNRAFSSKSWRSASNMMMPMASWNHEVLISSRSAARGARFSSQTTASRLPARTTDGNPVMCFDLAIAEQLFEPNGLTGLESSPRDTLFQIHCFDRLQRHWTKQSRR